MPRHEYSTWHGYFNEYEVTAAVHGGRHYVGVQLQNALLAGLVVAIGHTEEAEVVKVLPSGA